MQQRRSSHVAAEEQPRSGDEVAKQRGWRRRCTHCRDVQGIGETARDVQGTGDTVRDVQGTG